ncbi:unnamed protein product, partial [Ixodes persulcatus]
MRDSQLVMEAVASQADELHRLGQFLWDNPETAFKEEKAHEYLTDLLEKQGFRVQRNYCLPTAFRAEYGDGGPVVTLLCEYDALPGLGHACGHNLIAMSSVGAGIAVKAALEADVSLRGKVAPINVLALVPMTGKFDGVLVLPFGQPQCRSMRQHPLSASQIKAVFHGKSAHASLAPWEGLSALDAAVGAYVNISMLRQRMKPSWRVHGTPVGSAAKSTKCAEEREVNWGNRQTTHDIFFQLSVLLLCCSQCKATAWFFSNTSTKRSPVNIFLQLNFSPNRPFSNFATRKGITFEDSEPGQFVATGVTSDIGNIAHRLPCIHPVFGIVTAGKNHSSEFNEATGTLQSREKALTIARVLALTVLDVLRDTAVLDAIRDEFRA